MARAKKTRKPSSGGKTPHEEKRIEVTEIPGEVRLERSPFRLRGNLRYLSTDIDVLYTYILEKKRVGLAEAARKFKVSKDTAEDWGKILEDHGIIELHYPVAGDPVLRIPGTKHKKSEKKKEEKKKEDKVPGPKTSRKLMRFTKKRLFIMGEMIVLGEILIYILFVNQQLRDNLIPTMNFYISNLPSYILNLPNYISGRDLLINPIYFVIGIIIVIFWLAVAFIHRSRKKGYAREWKERHKSK